MNIVGCILFSLFSDLNSQPLHVKNDGNQVAELVVSRRLSREVVIPDDEGTIIGERLVSSRSNSRGKTGAKVEGGGDGCDGNAPTTHTHVIVSLIG